MAYFDNSATTAVCEASVARMMRVMTEVYGNPSSLHTMGVRAEQEVAQARAEVAALMGAKPEQITFTGSGTEANNLAILGTAAALRRRPPVAVTTAVEHPSVAACFDELEHQGWTVTRVKPAADGTISSERLAAACTADTTLVSVMAVNNETGARFDIPAMVDAVKERAPQAVFHTDCVQAAGKLLLKAERWGVDLMSVSAHKLHGPKGCGALYVRKGVRLLPRMLGGGQEKGLRSGTEALRRGGCRRSVGGCTASTLHGTAGDVDCRAADAAGGTVASAAGRCTVYRAFVDPRYSQRNAAAFFGGTGDLRFVRLCLLQRAAQRGAGGDGAACSGDRFVAADQFLLSKHRG